MSFSQLINLVAILITRVLCSVKTNPLLLY